MKLTTLKPRLQQAPARVHNHTASRITGRRLQRIRREHFERDPLCIACKAEGITRLWTELDHIVALHNGGKDTDANRQGLCAEHHAAKTKADMQR